MEEEESSSEEESEESEEDITGIQVPREKHISISKSKLLSAILSQFNNQQQQFTLLANCLDSILHAEHKLILEEMRSDYSVSVVASRRFQSSFFKLLQDAQFQQLSARDLLLTSALNTDYLLTLPIYVDWNKASQSNAIIFRRGYATQTQKGLLIGEKLDYLQSKLLQRVIFSFSKPLGKLGLLIKEVLKSVSQTKDLQVWVARVKLQMEELFPQQSYFDDDTVSNQQSVSDLPLWLAAQKAVPRYEGFLSSVGPRGRLLRKLLTWTGLIPSTPKTSFELDIDSTTSEHYMRPNFLSRISLADIWKPATMERCGNDILKMLKTSISILFSQSTLQEPAFQELILLYNEEKTISKEDKAEAPSLKLKIYERIPIPDLPVVFPHKKLSFRILDTVRLDAASLLGLLAFVVNYKFEDIHSSPSAILLDVIAATAFILYLTRLVLGYKQTRDRYQLLVNRTLYEKTIASGFGSVHFLLDASEQQQYKEAILAYAMLLGANDGQVTSRKFIADTCEKFIYNNFKEKVEMPIDKAMNTLLRLGLVTEVATDGNIRVQPLPCLEGYEALKRHWDLLLV
ncbi:hypothetical protein ACHQM5_012139 [Ranunculus cassubicifolius]